jgi:predicted MFS family arabinose efflux permease
LAFVAGSALVRVSGGSPFAQGMFGGVGLGAGGLAVAVVPLLEDAIGWRAPFWSSLALAAAVVVLLLAWAGAASPAAARPAAGPVTGIGRLARDGRLWRIAAFYTASYGLSVVVANWVVELLRRHGDMSGKAAAATGALTLALVVVSRPVGGWILRAHPNRMRLALAGSLVAGSAGTLALIAAQPAWLAVLGATLVGIGAGISFSPAFTWAAVARPDAPAAAVGLVNTVANVVVLAGTPMLGLAFSLPGEGRIGFLVIAALWLAALPSAAALGSAVTSGADGREAAAAAGGR